jgi:microsomal dipeptidase-like Zn-dependent dipeptidase
MKSYDTKSTILYALGIAIQNEDDKTVKDQLEDLEDKFTTKAVQLKVEKVYEVWVGEDMWDDSLSFEEAKELAKEGLEAVEKGEATNVVIDEHSYFHVKTLSDIESIGI